MPEKKSVKEEFLDEFTEEMIMNTKKGLDKKKREEKEVARAKREVEIEKLKKKFSGYGEQAEEPKPVEKPAEKIEEKKPELKPALIMTPSVMQKSPEPINPVQKPMPIAKPIPRPQPPKMVNIPVPPVQPPLMPGEVNFGKIAFLIKDPLVTYVESPGVDKNVLIKRAGVTTKTQITLSKEEMLAIIKSFSETARIPLIEGMLNARLSNLEMSAVVSETTNISFIVKKNPIPDMNKPMTQLQRPMMRIPTMPGVPNILPKPTPAMPPVNRPFNQPQPLPKTNP
jgi:hypothetical protein